MNPEAEKLKRRTKVFALDVLKFRRTLPQADDARDVGRQLVRAGTGVGSNYRAACRSRSKLEFAARIGVVLEEADESLFWLEVIIEGGMSRSTDAYRLLREADELTRIFSASRQTALATLDRNRRDPELNLQSPNQS